MKARWILLAVAMLVLTLEGATANKNDSMSQTLLKGCKSLNFNRNPETFHFGIVLGFVKGTYDEYSAYLQRIGSENKEKRISLDQITRSACKTALNDQSDDRFTDVFSKKVRMFVRSEYKNAEIPEEKKSKPKGIDAFFEESDD